MNIKQMLDQRPKYDISRFTGNIKRINAIIQYEYELEDYISFRSVKAKAIKHFVHPNLILKGEYKLCVEHLLRDNILEHGLDEFENERLVLINRYEPKFEQTEELVQFIRNSRDIRIVSGVEFVHTSARQLATFLIKDRNSRNLKGTDMHYINCIIQELLDANILVRVSKYGYALVEDLIEKDWFGGDLVLFRDNHYVEQPKPIEEIYD